MGWVFLGQVENKSPLPPLQVSHLSVVSLKTLAAERRESRESSLFSPTRPVQLLVKGLQLKRLDRRQEVHGKQVLSLAGGLFRCLLLRVNILDFT